MGLCAVSGCQAEQSNTLHQEILTSADQRSTEVNADVPADRLSFPYVKTGINCDFWNCIFNKFDTERLINRDFPQEPDLCGIYTEELMLMYHKTNFRNIFR